MDEMTHKCVTNGAWERGFIHSFNSMCMPECINSINRECSIAEGSHTEMWYIKTTKKRTFEHDERNLKIDKW